MPFPLMSAVVSSNVDAIGHDVENQELYVRFKGGGIYIYSPFTADEYTSFSLRSSIGRAVQEIKRTKGCRKLDDPIQKDQSIFAWTETVQFPQYVSINERGGKITITVREPYQTKHTDTGGPYECCGDTATMTIPREILDQLAKSVTAYLKPISKGDSWEPQLVDRVKVEPTLLSVRPSRK